MSDPLDRYRTPLRPGALRSLRVRLTAIVFAIFVVFALCLSWYTNRELSSAYAEAGHSEILAIARTFVDDIEPRDIEDRPRLTGRLRVVAEMNPGVTRAAVYATGSGGGFRLASTDAAELSAPVKPHDVEPIASGRPIYEEEREDGRHTAELSFPIFLQGMDRPAAVLGLYLDLAPRDAALAARQRKILVVALGTAIALGLLLAVMFGRSMFRPLDRLARATRAIRGGELGTRLGWRRGDEVGALARDFDEMASELERSHARLEALALTDPLTDLLNHRAFQERLGVEIARARREGGSLSVIAIDVDRFKQLNDSQGHAAGDEALRVIAQAMVSSVRDVDVCARVGGDEFMIVLPGARSDDAEEAVRRLRDAVAASTVGDAAFSLTISAGVAEYPDHAADQDELVRLADGAMYWSKRAERDGCSRYRSDADRVLSSEEAPRGRQPQASS